ncbi:MAG: glycoside hydrolase family 2 TIM barrel-domain containing protein [Phycisphaerae bacterium]
MSQSPLLPLLALAVSMALGACSTAGHPRQVLKFDKQWKFHAGDTAGADAVSFNDASWQTINVPHDYAITGHGGTPKDPSRMEGPFDPESPAGGGGGYLDAGPAWYRKTFTLSPSAKGHRVAIQFDGVYMDSTVYLNGKKVGGHPYGYTSFQIDLTNDLNFDGPNTLAVHTNVQQPCSRWYSGAGIYRHVYLNITNPVHIAPWGIYVTTPEVTDAAAKVAVQATIQNDSSAAADCTITCRILDADGKEVARTTSTASAASNATAQGECSLSIANPKRWSIETPTLYTLVTEVSAGGKIVDSTKTRFGVRTIDFTAEGGFFLNGKHVPIQGTCNHHDLGALGSAFNKAAMRRELQILKDMGCNALRTSHNPPDPEFLDLADEMGFVVMDEAFDEWKRSKTHYGYGRFFDEWADKDLTAMIHRDRNHPSIILWSIGNEIPEQGPPRSRNRNGQASSQPAYDGSVLPKRLAAICHREDPTRLVTAACNSAEAAVKSGFASGLDIMGINYSLANYARFKGRLLFASETSSALSTRGEYGLTLNSQGEVEINKESKQTYQCTSYDLEAPHWGYTAEADLLALKKSPWMAGEFVWTGFDYIGEPTPYPWPARSSYFGIVDLAGFPKDRYYLYQSQWTNKPVVHLLPSWNWPGFEGKAIPVWCFTNADSVELFLNGKSLGVRDWKDNNTLHLEWKVPYEPGTLKAVGKKDGKVIATDEVVTAGPPARIELSADRNKIHADGDDLSYITARILDKDGHICPNADNELHFTLTGAADIAGLDNGDPINHEFFQGDQHKAFHGLALAILRSKESAGKATLTVEAPGLKSASIDIHIGK